MRVTPGVTVPGQNFGRLVMFVIDPEDSVCPPLLLDNRIEFVLEGGDVAKKMFGRVDDDEVARPFVDHVAELRAEVPVTCHTDTPGVFAGAIPCGAFVGRQAEIDQGRKPPARADTVAQHRRDRIGTSTR